MSYKAPRLAHFKQAKACPACGNEFMPDNRAQVYCCLACRSKAAVNRQKERGGPVKLDMASPRSCCECGSLFSVDSIYASRAKYCSDECRVIAIRRDRKRFHDHNPSAQQLYNRARSFKLGGGDTLKERLYKRYPDLPKHCESSCCSVDDWRILEAAHRPGFERDGAHRVMKYYERHMFWMLCPNCHTYLDLKIKTPVELGLV